MTEVTNFSFKDLESKKPHDTIDLKVAEFGDTGRKAMRIDIKKGFQWTQCMKEKMGTDFCQAEHFGYLEKGHVKISMGAMDGGKVTEIKAGDTYFIPPNHDAITLEDTVMMEFSAQAVSLYKDKWVIFYRME